MANVPPPGESPLDPANKNLDATASALERVRMSIDLIKKHLFDVESPVGAVNLGDLAPHFAEARTYLARLAELLLAGYTTDPCKQLPQALKYPTPTEFKYSFWTGCGRIDTTLVLGPFESGSISVKRHWMGSDDREYTLHCRHYPYSANSGLLQVERVEGNIDLPAFVTDCDLDSGGGLCLEYFRLNIPAPNVPDEPALTGMSGLGYAGWADEFDLVLYITRFCVGWMTDPGVPDSKKIQPLIDDLEKTKFRSERSPKDLVG